MFSTYLCAWPTFQNELVLACDSPKIDAVDWCCKIENRWLSHAPARPRPDKALEELLPAFPFPIRGFHSDNGSEYINSGWPLSRASSLSNSPNPVPTRPMIIPWWKVRMGRWCEKSLAMPPFPNAGPRSSMPSIRRISIPI